MRRPANKRPINKVALIIQASIILIVVAAAVVIFGVPSPIIGDPENVHKLVYIDYTNGIEAGDYGPSEEHAEEISECISRYKGRRTTSKTNFRNIENRVMDIFINEGDEWKTVRLNKDVSYSSDDSWDYKIINADELISEILEIIKD